MPWPASDSFSWHVVYETIEVVGDTVLIKDSGYLAAVVGSVPQYLEDRMPVCPHQLLAVGGAIADVVLEFGTG